MRMKTHQRVIMEWVLLSRLKLICANTSSTKLWEDPESSRAWSGLRVSVDVNDNMKESGDKEVAFRQRGNEA